MAYKDVASMKGITWNWTAGNPKQTEAFKKIIQMRKPRRIVEIGTHEGVSAAFHAQFAPVTTFDVIPNPVRKKVWANSEHPIRENNTTSSRIRDDLISRAIASADFAFVDGSHLMPDVERDFELCIPCGFVVLHDYWQTPGNWPDVKEYVDNLPRSVYDVKIIGPFAVVQPCI